MGYDNYINIARAISNKWEFNGNSARGVWGINEYTIYSYNTIIYKWNKDIKKAYFNEGKYSPTTSRLQNIIRRCAEV